MRRIEGDRNRWEVNKSNVKNKKKRKIRNIMRR
jgi:hypothetical protein